MLNAYQIFLRVEASLLQMIEQTFHCAYCAIHRRSFRVAANREKEEGNKLEAIIEHGVHPVLLIALVFADLVESFYLFNELVVVHNHIRTFDICAAILLQQQQGIADVEDAVEDGFLVGIVRHAKCRGVGHLVFNLGVAAALR